MLWESEVKSVRSTGRVVDYAVRVFGRRRRRRTTCDLTSSWIKFLLFRLGRGSSGKEPHLVENFLETVFASKISLSIFLLLSYRSWEGGEERNFLRLKLSIIINKNNLI